MSLDFQSLQIKLFGVQAQISFLIEKITRLEMLKNYQSCFSTLQVLTQVEDAFIHRIAIVVFSIFMLSCLNVFFCFPRKTLMNSLFAFLVVQVVD